jgi:hypothetical protein
MEKSRLQLRVVKNVAASKTAVIEIPIGPRYHYIVLQHGYASGTNTIVAAATNISEIRVKVNNRVQRVFSGTQLRDLNLLNGTAYDCTGLPNTAPGVSFPLFLAEPWRTDEVDQDALAWKSSAWENFQIEVDLSTASTPTLVAYAITDDLQADPKKDLGIVKVTRQNIACSGTKMDEVLDVPASDWLQQVTLYPESGNSYAYTQVDLHRGKQLLHELSMTANTALVTNFGCVPAGSRTSNLYDLVIDHDGLLASAIKFGGEDAIATFYTGTVMSGTIVAMIQHIGPVG